MGTPIACPLRTEFDPFADVRQRSGHNSFQMRVGRALFVIVAVTLCACSSSQGPAPPTDASADALNQRTLQLPTLTPGASCPSTPQVGLPTRGLQIGGRPVPDYGYGHGPVYLSGQLQWFPGQVAILLAAPSYGGPALVRGRRLNGQGGFPFAEPTGRLSLGRSGRGGQWRMALTSLDSKVSPGCYAIQVDGTDFSEVIVFLVQAGPAPPD